MRPQIRPAHLNAPPELVALFIELKCSVRAVEKRRKVNRYYIYKMLFDGIEPTDRTKKGRCARVALFLPERKTRKVSDVPWYMAMWKKLSKEERRQVVRNYFILKLSENEKNK